MRISDWSSDVCSSDLRRAYILLGKVAQAQELPGKAIGLYGQALALEPNDLAALEAQGGAMVQRGAVKRAEANLERIRTLCKRACAEAQGLTAVIAKGPPPAVVTAQSSDRKSTRLNSSH